jgi:hypothetical protein
MVSSSKGDVLQLRFLADHAEEIPLNAYQWQANVYVPFGRRDLCRPRKNGGNDSHGLITDVPLKNMSIPITYNSQCIQL